METGDCQGPKSNLILCLILVGNYARKIVEKLSLPVGEKRSIQAESDSTPRHGEMK